MASTTQLIYDLYEQYKDFAQTRFPAPLSISYFIPTILLPVALLISPSTLSHRQLCTSFLIPIIAATLHAWYSMGCVDVTATDNLWWSIYLLLLKDPRVTFRRKWNLGNQPAKVKADNDRKNNKPNTSVPMINGKKVQHLLRQAKNINTAATSNQPHQIIEESYPDNMASRVDWVLQLLSSRPLYAWSIGTPSHDNSQSHPWPSPTRLAYLKDLAWRMIPVLFVFAPLSIQLATDDAYLHHGASIHAAYTTETSTPLTVLILRKLIPKVILRPLTLGLYTYSILCILWLSHKPLILLTNYLFQIPNDTWSPHTHRPLFGPFSGVMDHGLKGFWGIWWHQEYRHMVSEPGKALGKLIGVDHLKSVRYLLQCISAFLLSGVTHTGVVPSRPKWSNVSPNELRWGFMAFFLAQPLGMVVEVGIVEPMLRKIVRVRGLMKVGRMMWVICWMCFALTFLVQPFRELRYWSLWPLPFLPDDVRKFLAGNWIP